MLTNWNNFFCLLGFYIEIPEVLLESAFENILSLYTEGQKSGVNSIQFPVLMFAENSLLNFWFWLRIFLSMFLEYRVICNRVDTRWLFNWLLQFFIPVYKILRN